MTTIQIAPPEHWPSFVREVLEQAGLDVRAPSWHDGTGNTPRPVTIDGKTVEPHPDSGTLLIDGAACYSAAWQ